MKEMSCKDLGGACSTKFRAETFDEIAELSKKHGMEMFKVGDPDHMAAMNEMQNLMKDPEAMNKWFEQKRKEFEDLDELI